MMNPPAFQGSMRYRNYFEGWYLKNVSEDLSSVVSFIPGISLSRRSHSFVQVINGTTGWTEYFDFPVEDFKPGKDGFDVEVSGNRFSMEGLHIDIDKGGHRITSDLGFVNPLSFPKTILSPGIMGWYTFVPRMECYHGVVSMDHGLQGSVEIDGEEMGFHGGRGYIEKDWGRSFPESWIWLQCNNFQSDDISFMLSIAKIPWMGRHFNGFLSFLRIGDKVHRFATYTGARVERIDLDGQELGIVLGDRKHRLEITAAQKSAGELAAPVRGNMDRRIKESVDSEVSIKLLNMKGDIEISSNGRRAGLEIMGDIDSLR